mmetsp:Transcript_17782/g.42255  ORF Transcript_17782/g.42255 Transcript_17782/m.42255 type:complete len:220 (-) Transcript_17782:2138-2797(-)
MRKLHHPDLRRDHGAHEVNQRRIVKGVGRQGSEGRPSGKKAPGGESRLHEVLLQLLLFRSLCCILLAEDSKTTLFAPLAALQLLLWHLPGPNQARQRQEGMVRVHYDVGQDQRGGSDGKLGLHQPGAADDLEVDSPALLVLDIMPAGAAVRDEDGGGACEVDALQIQHRRRRALEEVNLLAGLHVEPVPRLHGRQHNYWDDVLRVEDALAQRLDEVFDA